MPPAVLALDQGTTGSNALVVSAGGEVLGRAYRELAQSYPRPGWVEHDPEEIWQCSVRVAREALSRSGIRDRELQAIGITNQRETTLLWERESGRPIHPAVVWQSRQSADICASLRGAGHEPLFRRRTGLTIDAYFSASKIRWLLDRYPDAQKRAEAGDLAFGTVDSWLLHRLAGVHATDFTNASRTLLFNIDTRRWDDELLSALDIPKALLPPARPSASVFGHARATGLPSGVPVAGIAGDQQAALFGQGCFVSGQGKNTYGTGCFLMVNTGSTRPREVPGLLTTLCCDERGGPAYGLEGSVFIAGAAIQWLRDELGLIQHAAETDRIAREIADTKGVHVIPAFVGLGAPYWDMGARGAIVGLTRGAGRREIVRATLESLAYQTRDIVEAMSAAASLAELRVDGGAAANDFLMQFQADLLGVPVDRPALLETTAAGAAHLAGLTVGLWKDTEELRHARRRDRLFTPTMTAERREALYAGWKQAVARVRS